MNKKRHSLAHILALAVKKLYPNVKTGIGPAIENGFYYDFDDLEIVEGDLKKIQKEMKKIISSDIKFIKEIIDLNKAKELFKNEPYKLELLENIEGEISIYRLGDFFDLCSGPHIESSKEIDIDGFKLERIAGAYWLGDEKNKMLTRIYGLAFETREDLLNYEKKVKEAEKRDHRLLAQKMDLYHIDDKIGPGLILWHPNGALLKKLVERYAEDKYMANGYDLICSPHIAKLGLWQTSGHSEFYSEGMYPAIHLGEKQGAEKEDYQLKPMNCPFHILVFNQGLKSYKDLPIRYAEMGTVYRYEKSGTLHGLTRVRGLTQDDAHIFCSEKDVTAEIKSTLDLALEMFNDFGFSDYVIYLSTKPDKAIGEDDVWEKAESSIKSALDGIEYKVDEKGGAFYGPKIDIKVKDAIGREWQLTTIQIDFNLAERFDITYIDKEGNKKRPILIHRALLGSIERFMGVLLEYHAGYLPLWLTPIQAQILPISDKHIEHADKVYRELREKGVRVKINKEAETLGKKIRNGEISRIPYLIVIGDKEIEDDVINVRDTRENKEEVMNVEEFIKKIRG